ncbi:MAG TPA: Glu/Leu/Phe/Val dehydrogenase dimerization domain-containing protein, partial [Polyangiaceae bacterium LLY-WYZ-15_(1-7)]|nr:Glu/Leu/Phe/Val dehydrogenase dimerization domain-containing protein [Polyangiaceae bacterium LLY-WYZ-15_(1-7)]
MQTLTHYMDALRARHPHFPELHQAVEEIARSVWPLLHDHPRWRQERVFDRLVEPDRVVSFRVVWTDDAGAVHVERGFRVQQSNLLGPYKGGLRFRPEVGESMLRFLAFEQAFKDALTGLPLGGAKGGATFDPRGRSEAEVMRFCQAFMAELGRHIGASLDVPAGDQGVGAREVGFLYGAYRRTHGLEQRAGEKAPGPYVTLSLAEVGARRGTSTRTGLGANDANPRWRDRLMLVVPP